MTFLFFISEPSSGVCGTPIYNQGMTVLDASPIQPVKYTWVFDKCPLENECLNNKNDCGPHEVCEDLLDGYTCHCGVGYERIDR